MARILRGEIRWADLNPVRGKERAGHRLVLILSQDVFNERSGTVIALAITGQEQLASFPLTYRLEPGELSRPSWIKISQIRTISAVRIGKKIRHLSPEILEEIMEGLNEIIG